MFTRIELDTILTETEVVVNSRPLVHIDNDMTKDSICIFAFFSKCNVLRYFEVFLSYDEGRLQVQDKDRV